jgi:hypothetical protein
MSLLPHSASFEERVQDCFTAYRGRGVELSALDAELAEAWAQTGAPFEVIARGLRKAAEQAGWDAVASEGGLRSLRACRRAVEVEIAKWTRSTVGAHEQAASDDDANALLAQRSKKLKASLRKVARDFPQLAATALRLEQKLAVPADFGAAERDEHLAINAFIRALPWNDRQSLLHQARRLVQNAQPISAHAILESLRFHRAAALKRLIDLPPFW